MCKKKILLPGTRVEFTYHEKKVGHGTVVNQYNSEPYDDTEVDLDQVYSWVENRVIRRSFLLPKWFFPKRDIVIHQLDKRAYLHSSDLRLVEEK